MYLLAQIKRITVRHLMALPTAILLAAPTISQAQSSEPTSAYCGRGSHSCSFNSYTTFYTLLSGYYLKLNNPSQGLLRKNWHYAVSKNKLSKTRLPLQRHYQPQPALTIGYFHSDNDFHGNPSAENSAFSANDSLPDITSPVVSAASLASDTSTRYTLERIDLKLAKEYIDSANAFSLQHKLGLRYLSFENRIQPDSGNVSGEYHGLGPAIGSNGHYALSKHYGLIGGVEYAAILSDTQPTAAVFTKGKADRIMSNIVGKVGFDYHYRIDNQMYATVEAGFQVNHYLSINDMIRGNFATNQSIIGINTNSIAFNGPYATIVFHV